MMREGRLARTLVLAAFATAALNTGARAAPESASQSVPVEQLPYILDIAVDQSDPSHLFLATRSGLYRAAPDGSAVRVSLSANVFWNLAPHPRLSNVLYALGIPESGRNLGIIVSRDSGRTWRQLGERDGKPFLFRRIEVSKADPSTIYGVGSDVRVSKDGGATWVRAGSTPDWPYDIAASSLDPDTVFVATFDGLHVSSDGGRSWRDASADLCRQPVTVVETSSDGVVYAFSTCDGLLKGSERTGEWVAVNSQFGGCVIQHLAIDPVNSDTIYAVVRCNRVLVSNDAGRTWRALGSQQTPAPRCVTDPIGSPAPDTTRSALAPNDAV